MEHKRCFKCGAVKPLSDFYKHPMMKDGHLNKCKECTRKDVIESRNKRIEYYREYDRNRANLPHRVDARKRYYNEVKDSDVYKKLRYKITKKYRKKYPNKERCHRIINYHLGVGHLKKEPCVICGSLDVEAHHPDYNYPLNIIWLCHKCHMELHRKLREEERDKNK